LAAIHRAYVGAHVIPSEHLATLAVCFGCSQEAADRLAVLASFHEYPHRAPIAHSGDQSDNLYLIVDGSVSLEIFSSEGQQAQLARHGPGEIFGAYPAPTIHRASISAIGDARLLILPTAQLHYLAADNAEIASGIATLLARQLDLVLDRMAARIGLTATGRFYRALISLADEQGVIQPAPVIAALALSVHTSRETASRALALLLRRGIMERQAHGLRIVSRRLLDDLVI
jgi:CRP/FNR family transcriptional regulator, cyclic AMP receptor protein